MRVAFYANKFDNTPTAIDVSWADLVVALSDADEAPCDATSCVGPGCPHKDGPAWSPVEVGQRRGNKAVTAITAAVLDLDHLTDEQVADVARRLDGYRYICHSTHQHTPPADNRLRVVMPLTRPVLAAEWRTFHPALIKQLGVPADPSCKDASRLYFLPRPRTGTPLLLEQADGVEVNVDEVLRAANGAKVKSAPAPNVEALTSVEAAREELVRYARRKERTPHQDAERRDRDREQAALLRRILDEQRIADAGARDATLNRAMTAMAFALPTMTPFGIVAAIARPSIVAMALPGDGDDPARHWMDEAEDMFRRAQVRRTELESENLAERQAAMALYEQWMTSRKRARAVVVAAETTAVEVAKVEATQAEDADGDWRDLLMRDRAGYASSGYNARIIIGHAPEIGALRWNLVTKKIELTGGLFEGVNSESMAVDVTDWLCKSWGITVATKVVEDRLFAVARENAYNPIIDYLTPLVWDGVPRLDTWLVRYLNASTVNSETDEDITRWVSRIGRMWLISVVARALEPGCQVDTMIILEGKQGAGKTSTLRILGGLWHSDTKIVIGNKDSLIAAGASWILEFAEIAAMKTADVESMKAFVTSRVDDYRAPYGRTMEKYPRMCVFAGTTNETDGYLVDPTGNRRYWPVHVNDVDKVGLAAARDQLFAEAAMAYRAGEEWWFDADDAAKFEDAVTSNRAPDPDGYDVFIREWWPRSGNKRGWVTIVEVATQALGLQKEKVTKSEQMRIARALHELGWRKRRVLIDDARQRVYVAPTPAAAVKVTNPAIASIAEARAKRGDPK